MTISNSHLPTDLPVVNCSFFCELWSEEKNYRYELNAKAKHIPLCSLSEEIFLKVHIPVRLGIVLLKGQRRLNKTLLKPLYEMFMIENNEVV